ncbi:hypothetical protein HAX54_051118, partial [Datura stramonium]|nr:hypothetical protein [Datura stramonium]
LSQFLSQQGNVGGYGSYHLISLFVLLYQMGQLGSTNINSTSLITGMPCIIVFGDFVKDCCNAVISCVHKATSSRIVGNGLSEWVKTGVKLLKKIVLKEPMNG